MRHRRHSLILLATIALIASILACNAPTTTPQSPPPSATPETSPAQPAQETPPPSPTEPPPEATATPSPSATTEAATTETPTPTQTAPSETTPRPTPAPTLDFPVPTELDSWRSLPDGGQEATIILHITGGAPPYTVRHDLDVLTTQQTDPAIIFEAQGCSALVHTITVESADGQRVEKAYWIAAPWCEGSQ